VHHPNTVQLLGAVVNARPYMIVYEFMTGGSVHDTLKAGGNFSQWRSLMLAIDLAKGLDHLHDRPHPIIHGDLRPSNLLLGGSRIFNKFHKELTNDEIGVLKVGYSVKLTCSTRLNLILLVPDP
jgi:serine/threonine protein kinase